MKVEEAIKKAIEGGWIQKDGAWQFEGYDPEWRPKVYFQSFSGGELYDHDVLLSEAYLDPSFWQSLFPEKDDELRLQWANDDVPLGDTHWLYQCHRFIDHLADGKDTESFFQDL